MSDEELRRIADSRPGMCTYPGVLAHLAAAQLREPALDPDAAVDFARTAGLPLEPWQEQVLRDSFATWRPARPGDTPGELVPEHGPVQPVDAATRPAGHAVPEPTGFITTVKPPPDNAWLRPRPAPRPPWWRRALDRIRGAR